MPDPKEVSAAFGEEPAELEDDSLGQGCEDEPDPEEQ